MTADWCGRLFCVQHGAELVPDLMRTLKTTGNAAAFTPGDGNQRSAELPEAPHLSNENGGRSGVFVIVSRVVWQPGGRHVSVFVSHISFSLAKRLASSRLQVPN